MRPYVYDSAAYIYDDLPCCATQFTGKERDSETGLDYFGARYYGSNMGRFTSPDPSHDSVRLDNPQTWNRYTYVLNNPLELIDPTGEEWNLKGSNSAEWVGQCGVADDCIKTMAISDNKGVTVYGTDGASDVNRYDANDKGMVNVADVAKNDDSQFQVAPQQHPENYLSPEATSLCLIPPRHITSRTRKIRSSR